MNGKLESSNFLIKFEENQKRRAYDRGIIMESNERKKIERHNNNSNLNNPEKDRIIESTEMHVNFSQK